MKRSDPAQFVRFGLVGAIGFVVDWACLSVLMFFGLGFAVARILSWFCAATATWRLNRLWTFPDTGASPLRQWGKFLSANALGGVVNYGVSVGLAHFLPAIVKPFPVVAIAAGTLAGMVLNFTLSKRYVFDDR